MNRRRVLSGSGLVAVSALGGCLDSFDDSNAADDSDVETAESACAAGEAVIEAIVAGDYDDAVAYSGQQYLGEQSERAQSDLREQYESLPQPDDVHDIVCEDESQDDQLLESTREAFDTDVTDAVHVEYTVDVELSDEQHDASVTVAAFELNGAWTAMLPSVSRLFPEPQATIDVEDDESPSVELTLTSRSVADGVYVRGDRIEPSAYELAVDETLTITEEEEGVGEYDVVAYLGDSPDDPDAETVVETITVTGVEEPWEDVDEIELDGPVSGWVGVSPGQIAGVENPTIQLVEGREYDLTWNNTDGSVHNIALVDDDGAVVDDYETDLASEPDGSQTLTFTATTAIDQYLCEPHEQTKRGDVEFVDS